MGKATVIPFGPQHPVLPEPLHLDLVVQDEKVIEVIPQIGFIHRGLEKLVEKKDIHQFIYVAERICGICSFGHSLGYAETVEKLMGVEVPRRAEYLRVILHELSRIHSHLLWLGLAADAFGFEALFMHSWRIRERVLDIFEATTGGRVILSAVQIGGVIRDIDDEELKQISATLDGMRSEYAELMATFLNDTSVRSRLVNVGRLTQTQAEDLCMVGPFARASNVKFDCRMLGNGAYGELENFQPILDDEGDCYARVRVRCKEVIQSIDIIQELIAKIPHDGIGERSKLTPPDGAQAANVLEQPRGECYYYARGNGSKNLERMRMRTPTSQNLAGLVAACEGAELADVPNILLTIDPCISCTER
ncbi:Hydrogenase-3 component E [Slackia heliotrinireducens]|uniref:Ech hydrogenase subunit E n=1 Tax=Slackia heliotrinireducens (strain ATCC 29202 / DSM 20476 / NCTC 11029 / RHS 1) TaxID=471855 RepID=C7N626_SLAHD|nr:nickel-dependent hydrogenase large subunit [Slackia heliotrinireducens]ACV22361.1 ech hydrogenase subunit E [Slackia heliotrinireducens DSM 20476]VEH00635.1 Hydrogenase-3 component E [Slackia heliotrinireducens]